VKTAQFPYNVANERKDRKILAGPHRRSDDAIAQKFVESISYDRRIYKQDIAGSIAHATMLAKVGLINDGERDVIIEGLKSIERDIESGNFVFDESLEDIHMVVEDALIKTHRRAGEEAAYGAEPE